MDDLELIKLAGKAAGIKYTLENNPLNDDALALRLAVKLRLELGFPKEYCVWSFGTNGAVCMEDPSNDPYAATRKAIVRAAAEIGRGME
jgi:hypothetical protein